MTRFSITFVVILILWISLSLLLYRQFFKRFYDIILSGLALLVLSPVLVIIAGLIKLYLGSPVVFHQKRPGKNGELFDMYKFRSMLPPQTRDGRIISDSERLECVTKGIDILSDEERLPRFGRVLRSMSLDELPELWNIFKGDMSIVGPRPLATIYLPYYTEKEMHRHDVRPGLTGLAQVRGRNTASWRKRFEDDLEYVENYGLFYDLRVIFNTLIVVFKRSDIGQGAERPESFCDVRKREWSQGTVKREERNILNSEE